MMRTKTRGIGAALIALTVMVAAGSVASARSGERFRGFDRLEHKLSRLDLSADTKAAVFSIVDEARPTQRALRTRVRDARRELRALLDEEVLDEAAVMAHVDTIGALKTDVRKHDLRTWLRVRAAMSPEDREAFSELRRHRRNHR